MNYYLKYDYKDVLLLKKINLFIEQSQFYNGYLASIEANEIERDAFLEMKNQKNNILYYSLNLFLSKNIVNNKLIETIPNAQNVGFPTINIKAIEVNTIKINLDRKKTLVVLQRANAVKPVKRIYPPHRVYAIGKVNNSSRCWSMCSKLTDIPIIPQIRM